jgi:hypothetical protein
MASKHPREEQVAAAGAIAPFRVEVERLIQKDRLKEAVKQAKLCHKQENTRESHRLLERAYFLRARQLFQLGMHTSAAQVAEHLLEFGVTSTDSVADVAGLLLGLGHEREAFQLQDRFGTSDMKAQLEGMAADRVVKDPGSSGNVSTQVAQDASRVRQSLERLQSGDEKGALEALRDLTRSSPLAEWKFFVRGLAAFYRRDAQAASANWGRLDPKRMAARIVRRMQQLVSPSGSHQDKAGLESLETQAFGEPVLGRLAQVRDRAARQDWEGVFALLGPLRRSLRLIDPKLAARLTCVLSGPLIREAVRLDSASAHRLVTGFTRVAESMAIDPGWNRLWALVWDGPHAESTGAQAHWSRYLEDLSRLDTFSARDGALAQALIWNRLAELFRARAQVRAGTATAAAPRGVQRAGVDDAEQAEFGRNGTIACLEKSLELAPGHLPTHRLLVESYRSWNDSAGLEAAANRLLAVFPDDLETLELLARRFWARDLPEPALQLARRARTLRPLDESLRELEGSIRYDLARQHALAGKWAEGRAEFLAAEQLQPEWTGQFASLARKAVFEATAGEVALSHRYLLAARERLVEPAPLWLALAIESVRYGMPREIQVGYAQLWEEEIKKPCRSETAGAISMVAAALLSAGIEYPGRADHVQRISAYLRSGKSSIHRRGDIETVCGFLSLVPSERRILEELVELGVERYPESPLLHFRAGAIELEKGTSRLREPVARRHLESALELAAASAQPHENALCPEIKGMLSRLSELTKSRQQDTSRRRGTASGPATGKARGSDRPELPNGNGAWDKGDCLEPSLSGAGTAREHPADAMGSGRKRRHD